MTGASSQNLAEQLFALGHRMHCRFGFSQRGILAQHFELLHILGHRNR